MEKIYNDDWMRKEGFFEAEVKVNEKTLEKANA
jgi:hypothetical protein